MKANHVNRFGVVCASGTDHRTLPEAELWTQVILQAINDLDGRTALTQIRRKILRENGLRRNLMRWAVSSGLVSSSTSTQVSFARNWPRSCGLTIQSE